MPGIDPKVLDELEKTNPDLVAQYRAKMAAPDANAQSAQDTQDYGSIANVFGKAMTDYGNANQKDAILHNRMQELGSTPTVQRATQAKYDPSVINDVTSRNVGRAKEAQGKASDDFFTEQKLQDRSQNLADASAARSAKARTTDPTSPESIAARDYLKTMLPNAAKIPNYDNLSEAQIEKISPQLFRKYELDAQAAARKEEARQRALDRGAMIGARREDAANAMAVKEGEYQAGTKVEGAAVAPGFRPTADDAKKAKAAKAAYDKIQTSLNEMDRIYKESGTNLVGDDATRMASLKTNILMSQKELDGLGVLNNKDEELTLEQIPDPTTWSENLKGLVGMEQTPAKIDQYRKNLKAQYESTLGASGYQREGSKAPPRGASPGSKPNWAE